MTTLWDVLLRVDDAYISTAIEVPCPICNGRGCSFEYCVKGKIRYNLEECKVVEDE